MFLHNLRQILIISNYFKTKYPMSYMHIAEKNSIAKQVSNILSNGTRRTGITKSQYNPVYQFNLNDEVQRFSSVRGHLFQYQLPEQCKSWSNYDNKKILTRDVKIVVKCGKQMQNIIQNLQYLAKKSKYLILWLDCDRQGEAIAYEVIQVCLRANKNLKIKRARFSAVTRADIIQAYQNLVEPNQRESNAVKYRMEIDFRLGCTFTRYQTLAFRQRFQPKQNKVISYGPCQLPTLGFVVQRYLQIKYFQPQDYYFVKAQWVIDDKTAIDFKWTKKNTRCKQAIGLIYVNMYQKSNGQMMGKVLKRSSNIKKRYRPYPLTTVQLQKIGTDKLRMSSAKIMQVAEKLYTSGFISYPRTQTNAFPKTMNLKHLVQRLRPNGQYFDYVRKLLQENKFQTPKMGNSDDQAHSPIHPVKSVTKDKLTAQQWRVYDLICRHFLACCSKDAIGQQFQILADIGGQQFKATYLTIKQRNFLQIYPFIKWLQSSLPSQIPNQFPATVTVAQQKTKPPAYLSQSNLIQQMQKNNIGTDSTIHQHIKTIQDRRYAIKSNNTLKPTSLGAAIIIAYRNLGMIIAQCDVRRMMEQNMQRISQGQVNHIQATQNTLEFMIPIYDQLMRKKRIWTEQIGKAMQDHDSLESGVQQLGNQGSNNVSNMNSNNNSRNNFQGSNNSNNNSNSNLSNNNSYHPFNNNNNNKSSAKQSSNNRSFNNSFSSNNSSNNNNNTNAFNNNNNKNDISHITCYRCQQKGHFANQCPNTGNGVRSNSNTNNSSNGNYRQNFKTQNKTNTKSYNNKGWGSKTNTNNQQQKKQRKPKTCPQCGVQGRHPNNSKCTTLKRNQSNNNSNTYDFL